MATSGPRATGARSYVLSSLLDRSWHGRASEVAEQGISVLFAVTRVAVIVQLLVALPEFLEICSSRSLSVLTWVVAIASSSIFAIVSLQTGVTRARPWGYVDSVVVCATYLAVVLLSRSHSGWDPGVPAFAGLVINAGSVSAAWRSRERSELWVPLVIVGFYAAVSFPLRPSSYGVMVGVVVATLVFSVAAGLFALYWRSLAANSDRVYQQSLDAAREVEQARFANAVHDMSGLLNYIAANVEDDTERSIVRKAALSEASRFRTMAHARVTDRQSDDTDLSVKTARPLPALVEAVADRFPDLRIRLSLVLAAGCELGAGEAHAVEDALMAVLGNARVHARAQQVVVYADGVPGGTWDLSVIDDGVGFDGARTVHGYGLQVQTVDRVAPFGISVDVHSKPGEGCQVTFHGGGQVDARDG